MPYGCGCYPLCDVCLQEQLAWHRGTAQLRGQRWAEAIARVCPIDKPWPRTPKSLAIAVRKIEDLTRDGRLRALLADEVELGAERWWNRELKKAAG